MGLFSRIKNIFQANANAVLDELEDPMKLFELNMAKLVEQMVRVEKEAATIIANRDLMAAKIRRTQGEVNKYDALAKEAAKKNDREAVKTLLIEKRRNETELAKYQELHESLAQSAEKARNLYNTLKMRVDDLDAKKSVVKAKLMAADAQDAINKINADFSAGVGAPGAENIEEAADRRLIASEAVNDLRGTMEDDSLKKYEDMYGGNASVEEEVEKYLRENTSDTEAEG